VAEPVDEPAEPVDEPAEPEMKIKLRHLGKIYR
jgi:hypothetical protein